MKPGGIYGGEGGAELRDAGWGALEGTSASAVVKPTAACAVSRLRIIVEPRWRFILV